MFLIVGILDFRSIFIWDLAGILVVVEEWIKRVMCDHVERWR